MRSLRLPRRPAVLLLVALALAAATLALSRTQQARAVTGTTGPIEVTVTPTDGLTDAQLLTISATASSGTMSEIRAHICMHGQPSGGINNTFDFGFQGTFCYDGNPGFGSGKLGAGDFEQAVALANTTTGTLDLFRAGIGSVTWLDELGDGPFSLQCDPTHPCDLVVQVQSSVAPNTFFFTTPLTYVSGSGTTTTTTTSAPGGGTTTTTTTTTPTKQGEKPTLDKSQLSPGDTFSVSSSGWKPSSSVAASFHSTPVDLGTLTANDAGTVQGSFTVPAGAEAGAHTVVLTGTDPQGEAQTATADVTVVSTSTGPSGDPGSSGSGSGSSGSSGTGSPTVAGINSANPASLPFTGADSKDLASWAVLAIAVGLLLFDYGRRRRARA
jgi:hypothetical protein